VFSSPKFKVGIINNKHQTDAQGSVSQIAREFVADGEHSIKVMKAQSY